MVRFWPLSSKSCQSANDPIAVVSRKLTLCSNPAWSHTGNQRLEVVYLPLSALTPYPRNARTRSNRQVERITSSIRAFGFTNLILADPAGNLLAGHGWLRAANEMGLAEVPVIELPGLASRRRRR